MQRGKERRKWVTNVKGVIAVVRKARKLKDGRKVGGREMKEGRTEDAFEGRKEKEFEGRKEGRQLRERKLKEEKEVRGRMPI